MLAAEVDEEDRDVGGGDAGDAGSLSDGSGTIAIELDTALHGKGCESLEIEVGGDFQVFQTKDLFGQAPLSIDVASILDLDFGGIEDLFLIKENLGRHFPTRPRETQNKTVGLRRPIKPACSTWNIW